MCVGLEAILLEVKKQKAIAEASGAKREVSIELLENPKEGDRVMIHAGTAIAKITDDDSDETQQLMEKL